MADRDGIWTHGGIPVEELPDPFAPIAAPDQGTVPELGTVPEKKRRRWPIYLYSVSALILITILWLAITAPLSRALQPLQDPALLLLSDDGHPIARRGAIKEAPVEIKLEKPAPAEAHTSAELLEKITGTAVDSPLCMTCGTKMRPAGSCYVCEGCGSTSGCS